MQNTFYTNLKNVNMPFLLVLTLGFLLITNRWMSWDEGIRYLYATDIHSYEEFISKSPELPDRKISFHHSQRFVTYWVSGIISKIMGIDYRTLTRTFSVFFLIMASFVFYKYTTDKLIPKSINILFFIYILNPYSLRYYLILPGMLCDTVFIAGMVLVLTGVSIKKNWMLLLGVILAPFGRQTAVLLIPAIVSGILLFPIWRTESMRKKVYFCMIYSLIIILEYMLISKIAKSVSYPSIIIDHVIGIFSWANSDQFTIYRFFEHTLRCLVPFIVLAGFVVVVILLSAFNREKAILHSVYLFTGIMIASQPFLAGPEVSVQNQSRLASFGIIPILFFLSESIDREKMFRYNQPLLVYILLLLFTSLHHKYSQPAILSDLTFVLLQFVGAFMMPVYLWFHKRWIE